MVLSFFLDRLSGMMVIGIGKVLEFLDNFVIKGSGFFLFVFVFKIKMFILLFFWICVRIFVIGLFL